MGRASALIGLVATLLFPTEAHAQATGADASQTERTWPVIDFQAQEPIDSTASATRPDFFLSEDPPAGFLDPSQIYRLSYDTLPGASPVQYSEQAYPQSLDVADRVVTVWLVRYR